MSPLELFVPTQHGSVALLPLWLKERATNKVIWVNNWHRLTLPMIQRVIKVMTAAVISRSPTEVAGWGYNMSYESSPSGKGNQALISLVYNYLSSRYAK